MRRKGEPVFIALDMSVSVKQTKLHVSRMEEAFIEGSDLQLEALLRSQKYQYYSTISASIVIYLDNSNPEIP